MVSTRQSVMYKYLLYYVTDTYDICSMYYKCLRVGLNQMHMPRVDYKYKMKCSVLAEDTELIFCRIYLFFLCSTDSV